MTWRAPTLAAVLLAGTGCSTFSYDNDEFYNDKRTRAECKLLEACEPEFYESAYDGERSTCVDEHLFPSPHIEPKLDGCRYLPDAAKACVDAIDDARKTCADADLDAVADACADDVVYDLDDCDESP